MDLLARILGGGSLMASTMPPPDADFWYHDLDGGSSPTGQWVDGETAQRVSAWYRGRDILATVLAMLPFPLYRKLPDDGGAEPAKDHPLYDVLHDTPNGWQDSFQWRRQKMFHLIDHGNGYDWIIPGARGFVDQLHPIHPRCVRPEQITSGVHKGRILYHIQDAVTHRTSVHTQDEIFHLRGASDDGVVGKGILEYARTSVGTALATESYAAHIYGAGTLNGGTIEVPGLLDEQAAPRLARSFVTKPGEWHLPKVLEQGAKWVQNAMTPEDAQMLLSRRYSIDDMARWLGVPRQMLENSDPSFGNAEQFDQNFITYSLGGWLSLFEFAVNGQLVLVPKTYYAEFTRDAIARGKLTDRWSVHVAAVNAGIKTVDEARAKEGLNKRGGKADELREPQNITGKPAVIPLGDQSDDEGTQARAIANAAAVRVLTTEIHFIQKAAVKHARQSDAFAGAVRDFYANHAGFVAQTLLMALPQAKTYCAGQAGQVLGGDWLAALAVWKTADYAAGLAALAMEEIPL